MIFLKDNIRYERVISKNDTFYYKEIEQHLALFLDEIKALHAHPNGPLFYTVNNVPFDEQMKVTFFLLVKEEVRPAGELKFHSYYSVEQMMSMRILSDFEANTQAAYSAIFQFMQASNIQQLTPPYHIIHQEGGQQFVTIKLGYLRSE
ncbi:MAG: DUF5085 family protein [Roseburia sp.]|nr:DUF5085 family protein [Roseburia sp.]